jgi:sigma-B regulation protein RsbU (phosphoserine phosphatase)
VSPRILVVDDDALMREGAQMVLARHFDVRALGSPVEALDVARAWRPDLAIVDVRMPEMDGFELLARLKAELPDVDVILMTGSVGEADRKLVRAIRQEAFYFLLKPFDREVLLTLVQRCLELRRLEHENRRYTQRMERELEQARAFQQSLLPPDEAEIGGLAVRARYLPLDELCGDFYDYAPVGDDGVAFLVADVSNHGASAAMLTGMIKSAFRSCVDSACPPSTVVARIAQTLASFDTHHFVTLFVGRIVGDTLEYVSAGHPEMILSYEAPPLGGSSLLTATGPAVHPDLPRTHRVARTDFERGRSRLLLFTDGITEARGEGGRYGLDRLVESAGTGGDLDRVLTDVRAFAGGRPLTDDITLLSIG